MRGGGGGDGREDDVRGGSGGGRDGGRAPPGEARLRNGGFLDGCWHHCGAVADAERDDVGAIAAPDGTTPLGALAIWYGGGRRAWEQPAPTFPCVSCCPRAD